MKIKQGFVLRTVSGSNVVIPIGQAMQDLNGVIKLNATGTMLWNRIAEGGAGESDLIRLLVDTYGIDEQTAGRDVSAFLAQLRTGRCIED